MPHIANPGFSVNAIQLTSGVFAVMVQCMTTSGLSRSMRKYIRKEKARIRREALNQEEAEKKIKELLERIQKSKKGEK